MSAYLVAADTFDYLASFARSACVLRECRDVTVYAAPTMPDVPALISDGVLTDAHERVSGHTPETVAAILRAENVRSLEARYGNADDMLDDAPYTFRAVNKTDAVTVIKSVHCLRYQSCEADNYETTLAAQLLDAIERAAVASLPGYDDAPWGWTRTDAKVGVEP